MVRFQSLGKTGSLRFSITGGGEYYRALEESRPGGTRIASTVEDPSHPARPEEREEEEQ